MTRILLLALGLVAALPALAQEHSLRGQWQVRAPSQPDYAAIVLVDGAGRMTWDAAGSTKRIGYIARVTDLRALIHFTNRSAVVSMHCAIQSSELLHCRNVRDDGLTGPAFALVRVGPGPKALAR